MKYCNIMQISGKRLFAGFVAEYPTPRIGTRRTTEQGEQEQSRFLHPPAPRLSLHLVDPERGESEEVYSDECGDDVGGGEELHGSVDMACVA